MITIIDDPIHTHTHTHTYTLKGEAIMAMNVHQLKEKLDNYRYGDRTTRV